MAVPQGLRVPVPFEFAFPMGAVCLGVEPVTDFDAKRAGAQDDQARDKESGERVWQVTVMDLDEEASRFGRSPVVKVKVAARQQPVPPAPQMVGFPPRVAFEGLTLTPWRDDAKCRPPEEPGRPHRCGARLAFSMRATGMVDPGVVADRVSTGS